jgi:hypothetical protein
MKKLAFLFLALIVVSSHVKAQSVTSNTISLCTDYNHITGEPSGVYSIWEIPPVGGGFVYVVYQQSKPIKKALYVTLEKQDSYGNYQFYSKAFFNNDLKSGLNWSMYDMKFTEEGDYRISVFGKGKTALAITLTEINFVPETDYYEEEVLIPEEASDVIEEEEVLDPEYDTYYYENSIVTFGTGIEDGVLINESNEFKLKGKSMDLMIKVDMDEELRLSIIYVGLYVGENYDEEVSNESFTVADKTWNWINVPITVYKKGKYVVDLYNQNDVFVNSGYFEVK